MTNCDKIVTAMKNLLTKKTKTITKNVTTAALINGHSKKVSGYYILDTVLLITIILLIAVSLCCYLIKYRAKYFYHFRNNKQVLYW